MADGPRKRSHDGTVWRTRPTETRRVYHRENSPRQYRRMVRNKVLPPVLRPCEPMNGHTGGLRTQLQTGHRTVCVTVQYRANGKHRLTRRIVPECVCVRAHVCCLNYPFPHTSYPCGRGDVRSVSATLILTCCRPSCQCN
jgi:hypothetical protein